jgi:transposase
VWYERYRRRIEASRLPKAQPAREAYAPMVGEDGFLLLDALDSPDAPEGLRALPSIEALRRTWQRHYERTAPTPASPGVSSAYRVRFRASRDLPPAAEGIESPYDVEARDRHKRDTPWTGDMVHVSETCDPTAPHLLTHVHTTPATVPEAPCTAPIQQALVDKGVPPQDHVVDAA